MAVDDFALRKGDVYATIVVDLEARRPAEVLPGREAAPAAAWLAAHPEVEIVTRDRARAYAEAARTGAPQARQVVDRWHVWNNLTEAVERPTTTSLTVCRFTPADLGQPAETQPPLGHHRLQSRGDGLDDGGRMTGQIRVGPVLRVIGQLPGRAGSPASSDHDKRLLSVDVVALRNGRLFCRYEWGVTLDAEMSCRNEV
ncbi:transposase [Nonomuraea fuscirosea]|uniref:transposase n=1 Tax=Nonomuraea fuscirosea TaxID=1291556 RepID=UPI00343A4BD9